MQLTLPTLKDGQYLAGLILKEDGTPDYWLVGFSGELEAATWQQAMDWAKELGGDLPNLRELNLLRANARRYFKNDWYWSSERNGSTAAFVQDFYDGGQYGRILSADCRVRAVSRFVIQ